MNSLKDLQQKVERLEPELRKTIWPPMTYMLIPSILKAADEVIEELQSPGLKDTQQAVALLARITELRANFRREA